MTTHSMTIEEASIKVARDRIRHCELNHRSVWELRDVGLVNDYDEHRVTVAYCHICGRTWGVDCTPSLIERVAPTRFREPVA